MWKDGRINWALCYKMVDVSGRGKFPEELHNSKLNVSQKVKEEIFWILVDNLFWSKEMFRTYAGPSSAKLVEENVQREVKT